MYAGSQTFNNLLNGNSFNRLFADTPTPSDPVIDLSSGGEAEDFDSHNPASRKRHHSMEVNNVAKRKAHEALLTESQKNRNRNMPLKKRGTANREEELNFLHLIANDNSNQAQNLVKLECATDSTTCDSSTKVPPKRYLNLEAKEDIVCDCFNCFPVLGSKGAPKCKKVPKPEDSGSSSEAVDVSMIPGPSGLQQKKTILPPVKKRMYYESDSDDSDDQNDVPDTQPPAPILIEDEPTAALTAPDLQLDWLSDSSTPEDDDVIFVSDRTAPIDLTADSDTDNAPSPANATSIDMSQNGGSMCGFMRLRPYESHVLHPTTVNAQRGPIMSSVANAPVPSTSTHRQHSSPPHVIINIPTPPLHTPAPRQTNFRNMITGNDVMLYDGQNYVPRFMRESPANPPEVPATEDVSHAAEAPVTSHQRRYEPSTTTYYRPISPVVFRTNPAMPAQNAPEISNQNPPNAHQNCRQHVGRCPFMTEGHHYNRPRRGFTRDIYPLSNNRPPYAVHEDLWRRQYQEQEIRRHYWSPSFNDNAPEVQVLRPPPATPYSFNAEPVGANGHPNHHRLVTALSDNNNNNHVANSTDSLRHFDRLRNMQQPNAHSRYRRTAPW